MGFVSPVVRPATQTVLVSAVFENTGACATPSTSGCASSTVQRRRWWCRWSPSRVRRPALRLRRGPRLGAVGGPGGRAAAGAAGRGGGQRLGGDRRPEGRRAGRRSRASRRFATARRSSRRARGQGPGGLAGTDVRRLLHPPAHLRRGLLHLILLLVGASPSPRCPSRSTRDLAPPQVTVTSTYIGASAEVVESAVTIPLEQEINGVEGMRYITSTSGNDGTSDHHHHLRGRTATSTSPRWTCRTACSRARRALPAQVNQTGIIVNKASQQLLIGVGLYSRGRRYDRSCSSATTPTSTCATRSSASTAWARCASSASASSPCGCGWIPRSWRAGKLTAAGRGRARCRSRTSRSPAGQVGQPPPSADQPYQFASARGAGSSSPSEFDDIVLKRRHGRHAGAAEGRGPRGAGRGELRPACCASTAAPAVGLGIFQLPERQRARRARRRHGEMERLSSSFPPGLKYQLGLRHHARGARLHPRGAPDARRGHRRWSSSSSSSSCTAGAACSSPRSPCRCRWSAPSRSSSCSASPSTRSRSSASRWPPGLVVDDAIVVIENIERFMQEQQLQPARGRARAAWARCPARSSPSRSCWSRCSSRWPSSPARRARIYQQFALTIAFSVALSRSAR